MAKSEHKIKWEKLSNEEDMEAKYIYTDGDIYVGTDDTTQGKLYLYGDATGSTDGGRILIFNADDHDSVVENWNIMSYSGNLKISSDADASVFTILPSGYIGINDDTPSEQLDVNGNIQAVGYVNATGGYKDNGTAGVHGSFTDNDGNTITVSGGIITALT